jgi:hypothetical protein
VSVPNAALADDAIREVFGLHAFFESWFAGSCSETGEAFATVEASLGPTFTMVGPDGQRLQRSNVIAAIRSSYGAKARQGRFAITIEEPEILHLDAGLVLVRYVEEQILGNAVTRRRSTALFSRSLLGPQGVQWVALHETWMRD